MYMPVKSEHFNGTPSYRNFYLSICAIRDSPLMNIYIPDKPFLVTLDFSSALFRASGSTLNIVQLDGDATSVRQFSVPFLSSL